MALTESEVREILKSPKARGWINEAATHEGRLRLHSETSFSQQGRAITEFFDWVKKLIPLDKYNIFLQLFRFPVDTVALTDEIYSALEKIFDGRDPVYRYDFVDAELEQDWEMYRRKVLREPDFWKTEGFEVMKTAINSLLLVDLPAQQTTEQPEPYMYFLGIDDVVELKMSSKEKIEFVIFRPDKEKIAVFDDSSFRVWRAEGYELKELVVENPHELGYCPARFFWNEPVTYKKPEIKKSPISNYLAKLDHLLFFSVSRKHLGLYASYPIYWGFSQDCDYEHPENGEHCDGGFIRDFSDNYIVTRDGGIMQCPVCSKKRLTGAGSFIDVPPPSQANEMANLRDPVGLLTIDKDSLEYNREEENLIKREIYAGVTGNSVEIINTEAINEKQVQSLFESRTQVLTNLKRNFEIAQKWASETICKLRYGQNFVSCSINYGTEFYLFSAETILEMYEKAKAAKTDSIVLDMLQDQFFETKYRNNVEQLRRTKILVNIDPFRHLTNAEVAAMYQTGQIDYTDYMLKVNFSTYIKRFEREQTNLVEFGKDLDFDVKINRIQDVLNSYITKPQAVNAAPAEM